MSCRFPLQPRHVDGVLYVDFYGISTVNSMLLGYIASQHGIEANTEKVSAITKMGPI